MKKILTKNDFVIFIYNLSKDYQINSKTWENRDIDTYLEALAGWVEDMEGYYKNLNLQIPENTDWNFIANMLLAAKSYE